MPTHPTVLSQAELQTLYLQTTAADTTVTQTFGNLYHSHSTGGTNTYLTGTPSPLLGTGWTIINTDEIIGAKEIEMSPPGFSLEEMEEAERIIAELKGNGAR